MATASETLEPFFLSDDADAVLAAARELEQLSHGEVKNIERLNFRTAKPERHGLLCAQIFGPVEDHRCLCGYLAAVEHAGEECPKCGVLCGARALRDERWGHLSLPWPAVHPVLAPRIAEVLGCKLKDLGPVVSCRANLNADGSVTKSKGGAFSREEHERKDRGPLFVRAQLEARQLGALLVDAMPVTPAGWRGSRRDAQDDAYARLVNRRNRLARLLELHAPDVILENEFRELQKLVELVIKTVRAELQAHRGRVVVSHDGRGGELLQAVLDHPLEYGARAVYADWLIEQGDPRGEFITLQLANAERPAMSKRESELLARHYDDWMGPLANVVDYVLFRRGFLASCRAQKPALAHLDDPAWSTVEHLNTELPEIVRQPAMRALQKLSTNARALVALCKQAPLPQIRSALVRISRCPPKGWSEVVGVDSLPQLRDLVLLHTSSAGTTDWEWFLATPLARQLTSLTLAMSIDRLDTLDLGHWLAVLDTHPALQTLTLSYEKKRLELELRRAADGRELVLTTTRSLVERVCMMEEETITASLIRALQPLAAARIRIDAAKNRWFGPPFEQLAGALQQQFGAAVALPTVT